MVGWEPEVMAIQGAGTRERVAGLRVVAGRCGEHMELRVDSLDFSSAVH